LNAALAQLRNEAARIVYVRYALKPLTITGTRVENKVRESLSVLQLKAPRENSDANRRRQAVLLEQELVELPLVRSRLFRRNDLSKLHSFDCAMRRMPRQNS
jgi:hypothetical protein